MSEEFKGPEDEHWYLLSYARPHTIRLWEARSGGDSMFEIATVRVAELVDGRWFAERSSCRGVCEWAVEYRDDQAGAEEAARRFMAEVTARTRWPFERWPPRREVKRRW